MYFHGALLRGVKSISMTHIMQLVDAMKPEQFIHRDRSMVVITHVNSTYNGEDFRQSFEEMERRLRAQLPKPFLETVSLIECKKVTTRIARRLRISL
jgi:hypothetical protein